MNITIDFELPADQQLRVAIYSSIVTQLSGIGMYESIPELDNPVGRAATEAWKSCLEKLEQGFAGTIPPGIAQHVRQTQSAFYQDRKARVPRMVSDILHMPPDEPAEPGNTKL